MKDKQKNKAPDFIAHADDKTLRDIFNGLSFFQRFQLKSATAARTATAFVKKDTQLRPWMFSLYALFLLGLTFPAPTPGRGTAVMVTALLWARLRLTPLARRADDCLHDALRPEALIRANGHYLEARPDSQGGGYKLKTSVLAKQSAKISLRNAWDTTVIAARAFKNWALSPGVRGPLL